VPYVRAGGMAKVRDPLKITQPVTSRGAWETERAPWRERDAEEPMMRSSGGVWVRKRDETDHKL